MASDISTFCPRPGPWARLFRQKEPAGRAPIGPSKSATSNKASKKKFLVPLQVPSKKKFRKGQKKIVFSELIEKIIVFSRFCRVNFRKWLALLDCRLLVESRAFLLVLVGGVFEGHLNLVYDTSEKLCVKIVSIDAESAKKKFFATYLTYRICPFCTYTR